MTYMLFVYNHMYYEEVDVAQEELSRFPTVADIFKEKQVKQQGTIVNILKAVMLTFKFSFQIFSTQVSLQ